MKEEVKQAHLIYRSKWNLGPSQHDPAAGRTYTQGTPQPDSDPDRALRNIGRWGQPSHVKEKANQYLLQN